MARSRFVIGIDLGTTNCVVAYSDLKSEARSAGTVPVAVLGIEQWIAAGQMGARAKFPSFVYLPLPEESAGGALSLPWQSGAEPLLGIEGEFARVRGSQSPTRLVHSAKSWLCHAAVDRTAAILPWGSPIESKISPVEASARYLDHLRHAWNHHFEGQLAEARFEEQEVIVTVPASFDEVARELTVEAARKAGIDKLTLLEEPQAAFYAWLRDHETNWQEELSEDDLILVCDIGGGTSDFSLIQVEKTLQGPLGFRRIAVGDHLLLGGDNMDLALAHRAEPRLTAGAKRLDAHQMVALQQACRVAKEALLADGGPESHTVAITGRGRSLIGGSMSTAITQEETRELVFEGFLPGVPLSERPKQASGASLSEFGLPYATDAGISRHLAAFLQDAAYAVRAEGDTAIPAPLRPTCVLFNGGVFQPPAVRRRVMELLTNWFSESPPRALETDVSALDIAVARGAAYFGSVRRGKGVRIAGGAARSFYLGLGDQDKVLCVASQGMQEGDIVEVPERTFELLIRQPVHFPFYSSRTRPNDKPGQLVNVDPQTMVPLPPMQTVLQSGKKKEAEHVKVKLQAVLTEVGTLEVWCVSLEGNRRWRLQFEVRKVEKDEQLGNTERQSAARVDDEELMDAGLLDAASNLIRETFAQLPSQQDPQRTVDRLVKNLEAELGRSRTSWPIGTLRSLWPAVMESADRRKAEVNYEVRWLNLAGFLLRPGHGYPTDEWRLKDLWRIFILGPQHPRNAQVQSEWWILWRRIAGGLTKGRQTEIYGRVSATLVGKKARGKRLPQEEIEMWRMAASFERLGLKEKRALGEGMLSRIAAGDAQGYELWSLGRLGARTPFHAPIDVVVDLATAEEWTKRLLKALNKDAKSAGQREAQFALIELARMTGDRTRDLDDPLRQQVLAMLERLGADPETRRAVESVTILRDQDQAMIFGESLPPALRLVD